MVLYLLFLIDFVLRWSPEAAEQSSLTVILHGDDISDEGERRDNFGPAESGEFVVKADP